MKSPKYTKTPILTVGLHPSTVGKISDFLASNELLVDHLEYSTAGKHCNRRGLLTTTQLPLPVTSGYFHENLCSLHPPPVFGAPRRCQSAFDPLPDTLDRLGKAHRKHNGQRFCTESGAFRGASAPCR
ncbi:MAG UNVERIFIED_CONTAM: hypothetical protein LVR18_31245 [Planctomycetaceae bacterium]